MSYRVYAPGTRKGNVFFVARVWVWGHEHEFVCCDADGRPTKDERVARRDAKAFLAKARAEGRPAPLRPGTPETFAQAAKRYIESTGIDGDEEKRIQALADDPIFGQLSLNVIVQDDINAAAQRVRRKETRRAILSNATKNREIITPASAVLHYAAENKWCGYIRVKRLPTPKPQNRRPAPGTGDLLIGNATGLERVMLLLWFRQGWRIGESLTLQAEKIDMAERTFEIWIGKAGEAGVWKLIEMHDDVFFALANLDPPLPKTGPVFPWTTRDQVYWWLRKLTKRLGVAFTPHMARHEFGSLIRDDRALVEVGTWTNEKSTRRYVHGDRDFKRATLSKVRGG